VAAAVNGYEIETTTGIFAPAKTPAVLVERLNQEIARVLNQPEIKEKFFKTAVEVVASSPQEFAAKVRNDMGRLGKLIKDAGIKSDQ
jgi:tripartite-type tricarboxylate transporter receptor subunit TctC